MKKQRKRRPAPRRKPIKGARPRSRAIRPGRWSDTQPLLDSQIEDELTAVSRVACRKMPPELGAEFERLGAGEPWPDDSPEMDRLLELEDEFFPLVTEAEIDAELEVMRQEREQAREQEQKPEA